MHFLSKLSSVSTDIIGVSAKAMLKAILEGAEDTAVVATIEVDLILKGDIITYDPDQFNSEPWRFSRNQYDH